MPLSRPSPGFTSLRETQTSFPSPGTPTNAVIITIAIAIIMVWFMPSMMEFLARGSWTWNRVCRVVDPWEWAVSTTARGTCRIPRFVNLMTGGMA